MTSRYPADSLAPRDRATHVLNRLGFGPRPGEVDRLVAEGIDHAVDRLLAADGPEPAVDERLKACPRFDHSIDRIVGEHQKMKGMMGSRAPIEGALDDLRSAKIIRAVHSEHQLREVLVDFWFNHFNVYSYAWEPSVPAYEKEAIRPHVFGSFRALLGATTTHPSMLFFLDNYLNVADRQDKGVLVRGINENFGRELLELHTVSVDAKYTQEDVQAAARALTGWDFGGWGVYRFTFNPDKHDTEAKRVFGLDLPAGGGQEEGDRLLDYLATHPATAQFVSWRLVQRFVADEPPAALVARCAEVFLATQGDIRSVLKAIFESREFWSAEHVASKVKTPFEFAVGALRAVDAEVSDGKGVAVALGNMGMPLYGCRPPTGYSNRGLSWLSAASQVHRFDFAFKLAAGVVPGVAAHPDRLGARARSVDHAEKLTKAMAAEVLGSRLSKGTREVASRFRPSPGVDTLTKVAGLLLASPEFQMR